MKAFTFFFIFFISLNGFCQELELMRPVAKVTGDYMALSPNSKIIGLASRSGIRFHDVATGKLIKELDINYANSITFSPDGKQIAFTYQKTIQIVDLKSGAIIIKHEDENPCYSITYSPSNQEIAFYSGQQLKTWNFETGQFWIVETSEHTHYCYREGGVASDDIQYSPDGKYLLSIPNKTCSPNAAAKLYDTKMMSLVRQFEVSDFPYFDINSNWDEIAILSSEKKILVKDLKTLSTKKTIQLSDNFEFIKYLPRTNRVLVSNLGEYSRTPVYLVDLLTNEIIEKPSLNASKVLILNPDKILTSKLYAGLNVYDIPSGEMLNPFETNTYYIENINFSEDFTKLAILAHPSNMRLIDHNFKHLVTFPDSYYKSYSAVSIPENKEYTITCGGEDVYFWNNSTGEVMKKYEGLLENNWYKVISKNGEILYQYGKGGCHFSYFNLIDGTQLYKFKTYTNWEPDIHCAAFSPDNNYFVTGVNTSHDIEARRELTKEEQKRAVSIWDLNFHKNIREFPTPHPVGKIQNITFTRDGNFIFTDSNNELIIYMWDLLGNKVKSFKGRISSISYDGKLLAANARTDNGFATIVYDIQTGKKIQTIPVGGDAFISKDNNHIITNRQSQIDVWNIQTGKLEFKYYIISDNDWVAIAPNGDYDGSENGLKEIHYSDGFKIYPLNKETDGHYKSGLIQDILN